MNFNLDYKVTLSTSDWKDLTCDDQSGDVNLGIIAGTNGLAKFIYLIMICLIYTLCVGGTDVRDYWIIIIAILIQCRGRHPDY